MVGDQVHGERRLSYAVDEPATEGKPVEQQKHAEAHHDDGQLERSGDEDCPY